MAKNSANFSLQPKNLNSRKIQFDLSHTSFKIKDHLLQLANYLMIRKNESRQIGDAKAYCNTVAKMRTKAVAENVHYQS